METTTKLKVKKMRIQLMDDDGRILSDKLVGQDPAISAGPSEKHTGPMRLEFTFTDQKDVEKVKKYLDQLSGELPIPSKKRATSNNDKQVELTENSREEIAGKALTFKDQDEMIKYLSDIGFVFLYEEDLETFKIPFEPKKVHSGKYQWMVRKVKESKVNPLSDQYDPTILVGVKILEERDPKVVVYLYNKYYGKADISLPDKPKFDYEGTTLLKFHPVMDYSERIKFSTEHRGLLTGSKKKPSKFYERWLPYVVIPNADKSDHDKEAGTKYSI